MRQDIALEKVVESLKQEPCVQSLFVKGSMGRNEHDEHSDIDLYCLVDEDGEASFLTRRLDHLRAYKDLLYYESIFIIAPQVIGVYEDGLHIDLFTVTKKTIQEKDYFKVLYDRDEVMKDYQLTQNLTLTTEEARDRAETVVWFLFQYTKAKDRGNDLWATEMLREVMRSMSRLLLYRYANDRAQLGMKAIHKDLPQSKKDQLLEIYEQITPSAHHEAGKKILKMIDEEYGWIALEADVPTQSGRLLELVRARI
ncbi:MULTISPECIES: nucleotidyltransferase domain-containing protein [Pontibacillus]|uniref:Nucleotidyltransferase domain-containing protein n=1 Tax=Pontibacillus chungwhensis TaxID=265426 RepID=A0ABY8V2L6_9BACI|nr:MULTISPECIES: nucleotidyltransferase domain-containing protein [Pontibacillus]MCD5322214.1 nucleotidyltransferase domain-containing protein [Pontibacillus sp. HN14]WIF99507.1 nucleotidyltransferase domain-containing protein [Pontibacillus chungwhensis]